MKYPFSIIRQSHPEDAMETFIKMRAGEYVRYHKGVSLIGCEILAKIMMRLSDDGYVNLFQVREGEAHRWDTVRTGGYYARRTSKQARRDVLERIFGGA